MRARLWRLGPSPPSYECSTLQRDRRPRAWQRVLPQVRRSDCAVFGLARCAGHASPQKVSRQACSASLLGHPHGTCTRALHQPAFVSARAHGPGRARLTQHQASMEPIAVVLNAHGSASRGGTGGGPGRISGGPCPGAGGDGAPGAEEAGSRSCRPTPRITEKGDGN